MGSERKWIPGFAGLYSMSADGEVFSHHFLTPRKISTVATDKDGYPIVTLTPKNGKRKAYALHRLVCRTFHGEPTALHNEAAHLDGDRTNARADNLKWVSKAENLSHRRAHGTYAEGEQHPRAKLTTVQAIAIRDRAGSENMSAIAREFGIDPNTVKDIRDRRRWRCLPA